VTHDLVVLNIEVAILRDDGRYLMIERGADEEHGAGTLAFPGGTLDFVVDQDILEATGVREVREEVGLDVGALRYVESHTFVGNEGNQVVDIVFLTRYAGGEPIISDPGEVAAIQWMSVDEILADPRCPPWIEASLRRVEAGRGSCVEAD
jgi:8-oxo-dGTP diphosphatase